MIISRKDNNPYLLIPGTDQPQKDGSGNPIANPHFGEVTEIEIPADPAVVRAVAVSRGQAQRRGVVRARAAELAKKGQHAQSISLLKTIGE